jgi:phosphoadenosine phosphosulfate reductase
MLIENRIIDGKIVEYSKVDVAIQRLKSFEPSDGYWLAFSGGKDSVTIKALADMAGVKYEAHYSLTTVDPPELVRFVQTFPDVTIDRPKETMWQLIVRYRMPPTRVARYCCEELKEASGKGKVTITGIRWAESVKRKTGRHLVDIGGKRGIVHNDDNDESRRSVEQCYRTQKTLINPIIDWSDDDVWEFIRANNIRYCCLYDQGFYRLGCIGCPQGRTQRIIDFQRWPTYKTAYIHAFDRMIAARKTAGLPDPTNYSTGQECFNWWIGDEQDEPDEMDGQIEIEDGRGDTT